MRVEKLFEKRGFCENWYQKENPDLIARGIWYERGFFQQGLGKKVCQDDQFPYEPIAFRMK